MCQLLQDYIMDEAEPRDNRELVFRYFGTFVNASITMFEISMGNWVITCRLLYEHVSAFWGFFYLLYRCCFLFAILKVITAVFIAETAKSARFDEHIAITKAQTEKDLFIRKLGQIFVELDDSG